MATNWRRVLTAVLPTDHVACGKDVREVRTQVAIDPYRASAVRRYSRRVEPDSGGIGAASGCHEKPLGSQFLHAMRSLDLRNNLVAFLAEAADGDSGPHVDALVPKELLHG